MSLGIQLMCRGKSHKKRKHAARKKLRGQKRELKGTK